MLGTPKMLQVYRFCRKTRMELKFNLDVFRNLVLRVIPYKSALFQKCFQGTLSDSDETTTKYSFVLITNRDTGKKIGQVSMTFRSYIHLKSVPHTLSGHINIFLSLGKLFFLLLEKATKLKIDGLDNLYPALFKSFCLVAYRSASFADEN